MAEKVQRPELKPVLYPNGQKRYADAGATQQGGPIPMKECSACGGKVVFVQSSKTGKWYLADCFPYAGARESYFYVKSEPHFKSCEKRVARKEEEMHEWRFIEERDSFVRSFDRTQPNWIEAFEAGLKAIEEKYGKETP